ncbi:MAG: ATP-binding protein [Acidobacteriota bacterium]|nr:ATP-binding protein [Acidobacteriota bacterium]
MPIRLRLTLWYLLILTIILGIVAAGVYGFVSSEESASVDRILRERVDAFARAYAGEANEQESEEALKEVARDFGRGSADIFVYTSSARLLARSPMRLLQVADARAVPEIRAAIERALAGHASNITANDVRCVVAPIGGPGKPRYVFVSTESLAGRRNALAVIRNAFTIVIPAALVIAAIGGYFLASRSLAPVAQMTDAASRIEAANLSERIAVANSTDELGRLAAVLNALFERLERSFQQQKQLLADTSHELRTPVTIIRSEAEVTLSRQRSVDEYRHALEVIRSESSHLTSLIEGVLLLARADGQQTAIDVEAMDLGSVIEESVQALRRVADARQIALTCTTDGPMPMRGNAELLRRMLLNLLDNAIKFTNSGGHVRLDAHRDGANDVITISDTGRGISPEAQGKVFDRFFRADGVRGRDDNRETADGAGLGLSIARWVARAHGGDLRLLSSSPGGSTFQAVLPVD